MDIRRLTVFLALLASPTLAQELPDRVPIGEGHMTVGFELKTTDKGNGPNGRTTAHSLMRYIIPKPTSRWTSTQQSSVDRWSSLSLAERTAFFFSAYAGGYNSTNFVVDTERYPHLEGRVSWYGSSLGIPHIEIRSLPFDSPKEAYAAMRSLRSSVRETIAFHLHMRFPDAGVAGSNASTSAEWLRRASWAIWLRRAHVSSQTSFVLKQADNQAVSPREIAQLEERLRSGQMGELLGRRGLRVDRMRGPDGGTLIDVELRGLMKDLPTMRRFLAATGQAFGQGEFGPWSYERGPYQDERGIDQPALSRTSRWSAQNVQALGEAFVEGIERHGVQTSLTPDQLREAVGHLAKADTVGGRRTLLPSSFDWLFLPLEHDGALPEGVQEQVEANKRRYLRKLARLAERVHGGEFGEPGGERYRALSVASRTRRILHDFVNETYADAGRSGKLYEWYETSLFRPGEVEQRTRRWRRETGRNRAEAYRRARQARGMEIFRSLERGLPHPFEATSEREAERPARPGGPTRSFDRLGLRAEGRTERPSGSSLGVSGYLGRGLDRAVDRSSGRERYRRGR